MPGLLAGSISGHAMVPRSQSGTVQYSFLWAKAQRSQRLYNKHLPNLSKSRFFSGQLEPLSFTKFPDVPSTPSSFEPSLRAVELLTGLLSGRSPEFQEAQVQPNSLSFCQLWASQTVKNQSRGDCCLEAVEKDATAPVPKRLTLPTSAFREDHPQLHWPDLKLDCRRFHLC